MFEILQNLLYIVVINCHSNIVNYHIQPSNPAMPKVFQNSMYILYLKQC